jgi:hypothetical protein
VHEIEVTVYGWKLIALIEARTKIPLAGKVVKSQAHEVLCMWALAIHTQANLAGAARLRMLVVAKGLVDGVELWWLDQQEVTFRQPMTVPGQTGSSPGSFFWSLASCSRKACTMA